MEWKRLLKIDSVNPNSKRYHYLDGYHFGEYKYPFQELLEMICDHFNIEKPPLKFSNRGYRYAGKCKKDGWSKTITEIILHNRTGKDVGTLVHEIAHCKEFNHGYGFRKWEDKILRFLEDNVFEPPEGHSGWRKKLAKSYVVEYGDNIDLLEYFAGEFEIDSEELFELIIDEI